MFLSHCKEGVSSDYSEETVQGKQLYCERWSVFLDPDEGTVTYEDTNIHQCPEIKQKIVYVPDSTNILNGYTIKEIVKFYKAVYTAFDEQYFYELLERFNLPNKRIRSYSKGMKALLAIIFSCFYKKQNISF